MNRDLTEADLVRIGNYLLQPTVPIGERMTNAAQWLSVCPYDCDGCHDDECPCDRMGCAGAEVDDETDQ